MATKRAGATSKTVSKTAPAGSKSLSLLARKKEWKKPDVLAAFAEHGRETVSRLAALVSKRDLLKTVVAYQTLSHLLFELEVNPKLDAAPLFPLLEPVVRFPTYDPDRLRQFELVRTYAMRLLARAKHPAARARLVRTLESFPEAFDQQSGSCYLFALAEIATDLGDGSLAPLFTPLLEKMLLTYDARQRENAIGPTREMVTKLSRKKK